jgi:hypothetical protein
MDTVKQQMYEEKEEICGARSGYGNTGTDATVMRTNRIGNEGLVPSLSSHTTRHTVRYQGGSVL